MGKRSCYECIRGGGDASKVGAEDIIGGEAGGRARVVKLIWVGRSSAKIMARFSVALTRPLLS